MSFQPQVIAFYLPQYHPTPSNSEWWGAGFTEWTNVAKAKKLYPGHYQPKIPADLGFYDLRLPETRKRQAELAKEAGIAAFCYYHYWFGNGRQELELPFNEVLRTGEPDFPFCLCWANESWSRKLWDKDGAIVNNKVLVEQTYPGRQDDRLHFECLLPAFKDHRYMKVEGKPIFVVYRPFDYSGLAEMISLWNELARQNELPGIFFVGYTLEVADEYSALKSMGFDAVCSCRMRRQRRGTLSWALRKILSRLTHMPELYNYKNVYPTLIGKEEAEIDDVFPTLMPNWDHTPRSGAGGYLFTNSTPELFEKHASDVFQKIAGKPQNRQLCFLKSWNEWGEGNYMEPDLRYGRGYIHALRSALSKISR